MSTLDLDMNKRYTYADYLTWMDDVRRELFNGVVKLMTPAPARKHQEISFNWGMHKSHIIECSCIKAFCILLKIIEV